MTKLTEEFHVKLREEIDDFLPLRAEHQRQIARFRKTHPVILTENEQSAIHAWVAFRRTLKRATEAD